MFISPSRARKQKRIKMLKTVSALIVAVALLTLVSYLFLSGFNYLEEYLGWKNNIIAGLITGIMAVWVLMSVIIQYFHKRSRKKFYDKLSLGIYVFLTISLVVAFFINFGLGIGFSFLLIVLIEGGTIYYRQLTAQKKKSLKRKLPWLFYR